MLLRARGRRAGAGDRADRAGARVAGRDPVLRVMLGAAGAGAVARLRARRARAGHAARCRRSRTCSRRVREGDTSIRARDADPDDALGLALWEINALAAQARQRRFEALEAASLLRQVMESIDVALFAFDPEGRLRLVNRDGEQLLALPAERALGRDAASLGLAETLEGETPRLVELHLPGRAGRWELRRGTYRHDGRPHRARRALRPEPRAARGGTPGVAAADPRAEPRDQQLAGARSSPSPAACGRSSNAAVAEPRGRPARRTGGDRDASRSRSHAS